MGLVATLNARELPGEGHTGGRAGGVRDTGARACVWGEHRRTFATPASMKPVSSTTPSARPRSIEPSMEPSKPSSWLGAAKVFVDASWAKEAICAGPLLGGGEGEVLKVGGHC